MIYLWDSVTTIHFIKKNPNVKQKLDTVGDKNVFLCHIVVGELFFGAYNSSRVQENLKTLGHFLKDTNILPMLDAVADHYGQIKIALKKKGKPIKENDLWIAAYAGAYGATVVSEDKHYSYIDTIKTEDWVKLNGTSEKYS